VLHVVPKLIGRGVRLFDAGEVDLRCVETIQGELPSASSPRLLKK
jgi:hypothetical protein